MFPGQRKMQGRWFRSGTSLKCLMLVFFFSLFSLREKYKLKEREEIWHKIEELAKQNPQVGSSPQGASSLRAVAAGVLGNQPVSWICVGRRFVFVW